MHFLKGHGTENDFVVIPDADGRLDLTAPLVRALCDRRAGLGADGVLRVVHTSCLDTATPTPDSRYDGGPAPAEWFMDYRNADGSLSEMCGNGVRVFVAYLVRAGLADPRQPIPVATRGGTKLCRVHSTEPFDISVDMGPFDLPDVGSVVVTLPGAGLGSLPATAAWLPNPHAVAFLPNDVALADLTAPGGALPPSEVTPTTVYPDGVNVEFVRFVGPRHIELRVHERGSGETRSCGTGACAAMLAARRHVGDQGESASAEVAYRVDVPGGTLTVTERADGHVELRGPAVLLAVGDLDTSWVDSHR
ncbi:MAG: diaminopimelate epimerase [Actinomycetes bacterium]